MFKILVVSPAVLSALGVDRPAHAKPEGNASLGVYFAVHYGFWPHPRKFPYGGNTFSPWVLFHPAVKIRIVRVFIDKFRQLVLLCRKKHKPGILHRKGLIHQTGFAEVSFHEFFLFLSIRGVPFPARQSVFLRGRNSSSSVTATLGPELVSSSFIRPSSSLFFADMALRFSLSS